MKKIVIAGAGHGGLTVAALLSKKGYNVTVYEKNSKDEMGYDWHDFMNLKVFTQIGLPHPDNFEIIPSMVTTYSNPEKSVYYQAPAKKDSNSCYIHRKELINFLIKNATESGVKIEYETEVLSALYSKEKIYGLHIRKNGKCQTVYADLVIDSLGIDSPVRRNLPDYFGIKNDFDECEAFYTYRAYYEKKLPIQSMYKNCVYFFHCDKPGMDWVIDFGNDIDILIGSFKKLTSKEITDAVNDFNEEYIAKGDTVSHGGLQVKIPLRNTLPMLIADGYVLIGDSGSMTEPLSGSGINMSISAGKILADTIFEIGEKDFTKENLWSYQYNYLTKIGNRYLGDYSLKKLLEELTSKELNYLMNSGVISQKEICSNGLSEATPKELLNKAVKIIPILYLTPQVAKMLKRNSKIKKANKLLPENYNKEKVSQWLNVYITI